MPKTQEIREKILEQLRQHISNRGSRSTLLGLTDSQLWHIFLQWRSGVSTRQIARELSDTVEPRRSVEGWKTTLQRYRRRILHLLPALPLPNVSAVPTHQPPPFQHHAPDAPTPEIARLNQHIQEADELLCQLREDSRRTGKPQPDLSKLENSYCAMLKTRDKLMRTAEQSPPRRPLMPTERQTQAFHQLVEMIDVDRFCNAAYQLLTDIEEHVLTLEYDEEGNYEIRPRTEEERIRDYTLGICGGIQVKPDGPESNQNPSA